MSFSSCSSGVKKIAVFSRKYPRESFGVHPDIPFVRSDGLLSTGKASDSFEQLTPAQVSHWRRVRGHGFSDLLFNKALVRRCNEAGRFFPQPEWLALLWMNYEGTLSALTRQTPLGRQSVRFGSNPKNLPARPSPELFREIFFDSKNPELVHDIYVKPGIEGGGGRFVTKLSLCFAARAVSVSSESLEFSHRADSLLKGAWVQFEAEGRVSLKRTFSSDQELDQFLAELVSLVPAPLIERHFPCSLTALGHRAELRLFIHDTEGDGVYSCTGHVMKVSPSSTIANVAAAGSWASTEETLLALLGHHAPHLSVSEGTARVSDALKSATDQSIALTEEMGEVLRFIVEGLEPIFQPAEIRAGLPRYCVDLAPLVSTNGAIEWWLVEAQPVFDYSGIDAIDPLLFDRIRTIDNRTYARIEAYWR